jgi:hypothetical protein
MPVSGSACGAGTAHPWLSCAVLVARNATSKRVSSEPARKRSSNGLRDEHYGTDKPRSRHYDIDEQRDRRCNNDKSRYKAMTCRHKCHYRSISLG